MMWFHVGLVVLSCVLHFSTAKRADIDTGETKEITDRPAYQTVTTQAPTEPPLATPPPEPSRDPPRSSAAGEDDCPCRDSAVGDAEESPELRLRRRNHALGLSMDEGIYAEYLQSEIDANRARIAYYAEVSKLYADALKSQGEFYESYQRRIDLELAQMNQRSQCKENY